MLCDKGKKECKLYKNQPPSQKKQDSTETENQPGAMER